VRARRASDADGAESTSDRERSTHRIAVRAVVSGWMPGRPFFDSSVRARSVDRRHGPSDVDRPAADSPDGIRDFDVERNSAIARHGTNKGERHMNLQYPYGFDASGHTAQTDLVGHIRDMIEQILFTSPGERVNRPTFGTGTATLVFAPNSDALAAAQQQLIQAALQQWLSDLIRVVSVEVENLDATLNITIRYLIVQTQQPQTERFVYGGAAA
jgi:phage baseplate assembly protein W